MLLSGNFGADYELQQLFCHRALSRRGPKLTSAGPHGEIPRGPARKIALALVEELSGDRLGPYEILSLLGSGGMGEVFRARDTSLARDVALKFLPGAFALDPDRLARFRREAHVLAALNHPHIASIYGLVESNGAHALVLELVEGSVGWALVKRAEAKRRPSLGV